MESPDVIVVGGGAIGVAVAYELGRRGAAVRVLDRDGIGASSSTSSGNAGLICPSHATPLANPRALREGIAWSFRRDGPLTIRPHPEIVPWLLRFAAAARPGKARRGEAILRNLSLRSLDLHAKLAASGLDTGFERRGILNVYETEELFVHGAQEARRAAQSGLQVDVLDPAAARSLEPSLTGGIAGAVYYPSEAHCDPQRYVAALAQAAAQTGVELTSAASVAGLRTRGSRVEGVETTAGFMAASRVILAAGAWSARLARSIGLRLPIAPGKGYHMDLTAPAPHAAVPVFLQEARIVATPLRGRLRLAGTLEFTGFDQSIEPGRVDGLRRAAARALPVVAALDPIDMWAGLRPCTPDALPLVGRPRAWENLFLATGHGMLGLTLSPVTAEIVAGLVLGQEPPAPYVQLSPNRFLGGRRAAGGRMIDDRASYVVRKRSTQYRGYSRRHGSR